MSDSSLTILLPSSPSPTPTTSTSARASTHLCITPCSPLRAAFEHCSCLALSSSAPSLTGGLPGHLLSNLFRSELSSFEILGSLPGCLPSSPAAMNAPRPNRVSSNTRPKTPPEWDFTCDETSKSGAPNLQPEQPKQAESLEKVAERQPRLSKAHKRATGPGSKTSASRASVTWSVPPAQNRPGPRAWPKLVTTGTQSTAPPSKIPSPVKAPWTIPRPGSAAAPIFHGPVRPTLTGPQSIRPTLATQTRGGRRSGVTRQPAPIKRDEPRSAKPALIRPGEAAKLRAALGVAGSGSPLFIKATAPQKRGYEDILQSPTRKSTPCSNNLLPSSDPDVTQGSIWLPTRMEGTNEKAAEAEETGVQANRTDNLQDHRSSSLFPMDEGDENRFAVLMQTVPDIMDPAPGEQVTVKVRLPTLDATQGKPSAASTEGELISAPKKSKPVLRQGKLTASSWSAAKIKTSPASTTPNPVPTQAEPLPLIAPANVDPPTSVEELVFVAKTNSDAEQDRCRRDTRVSGREFMREQ